MMTWAPGRLICDIETPHLYWIHLRQFLVSRMRKHATFVISSHTVTVSTCFSVSFLESVSNQRKIPHAKQSRSTCRIPSVQVENAVRSFSASGKSLPGARRFYIEDLSWLLPRRGNPYSVTCFFDSTQCSFASVLSSCKQCTTTPRPTGWFFVTLTVHAQVLQALLTGLRCQ